MQRDDFRLIDWAPIAITLLSVCGLLGMAYGANDPPATRPVAEKQIAVWIEDLGADDYATRTAATRELLNVGPGATAALHKAASGTDPERVARVNAILSRLERAPNSAEREMLDVFQSLSAKGGRQVESAKVVDAATCELSVKGRGGRVVMRCGGQGIVVSTEPHGDIKGAPQEVRARDVAELKNRYPDAWDFYNYTTRNMGGDDGAAMRKWFEQFLAKGG